MWVVSLRGELEMKDTPETIDDIKAQLEKKIGQRIELVVDKGRKKTRERRGVLKDTYPAIFIIELNDEVEYERLSFSYTDVLTGIVDITFLDKEADSNSVDNSQEEV